MSNCPSVRKTIEEGRRRRKERLSQVCLLWAVIGAFTLSMKLQWCILDSDWNYTGIAQYQDQCWNGYYPYLDQSLDYLHGEEPNNWSVCVLTYCWKPEESIQFESEASRKEGARLLMALYVRRRVLNSILDFTGSQWKDRKIGVIWSILMNLIRTLTAVFWFRGFFGGL